MAHTAESIRQWSARKVTRMEKVRYIETTHPFETQFAAEEEFITYEGNFRIEIDVEGILSDLCYRAAMNSKGVTKYLGGKVKVTRLSANEVSRRTRVNPLPTVYERVPE